MPLHDSVSGPGFLFVAFIEQCHRPSVLNDSYAFMVIFVFLASHRADMDFAAMHVDHSDSR